VAAAQFGKSLQLTDELGGGPGGGPEGAVVVVVVGLVTGGVVGGDVDGAGGIGGLRATPGRVV
jgi:hypothetical protein